MVGKEGRPSRLVRESRKTVSKLDVDEGERNGGWTAVEKTNLQRDRVKIHEGEGGLEGTTKKYVSGVVIGQELEAFHTLLHDFEVRHGLQTNTDGGEDVGGDERGRALRLQVQNTVQTPSGEQVHLGKK